MHRPPVLRSFRANAFFFRDTMKAVEENCFAHSSPPEQHHALDRSLSEQPVHVGGGVREQSVAANSGGYRPAPGV
jgi:hypothetical protein